MTISLTTTTVSASRTLRCFGTLFCCIHVGNTEFFPQTGRGFRDTVDRIFHSNLGDVAAGVDKISREC